VSRAGQSAAWGKYAHWFLCATPFLAAVLVAIRPLRVPVLHQGVGAAVFALVVIAMAVQGVRASRDSLDWHRAGIVAGILLMSPFTLVALLWVGLGTPWDATPTENLMRYVVLLAATIAVTGGFLALWEAFERFGGRVPATLGLGMVALAGAAYVVWLSFMIGASSARVRTGALPDAYLSINDALDVLVFAACSLTYLATAAFAFAFGQRGLLGRRASAVLCGVALLALGAILVRGLSFPDPTADSAPWYLRPGFIAGIPAVPWILPHILGATILRRTGVSDVEVL
jgi:hypothetical protein